MPNKNESASDDREATVKQVMLRMTPEEHSKISEVAEADRRAFSNMCLVLIFEAIAARAAKAAEVPASAPS
jgi:hypothetical protein